MRLTPLKIFAAVALLSVVGAGAVASRAAGDTTLRDISRYREWTRVTDAPLSVDFSSPGG